MGTIDRFINVACIITQKVHFVKFENSILSKKKKKKKNVDTLELFE